MTTPTTAKKTRVVRTPAQVAQDLLDAAKARHDRAQKAAKRLDTERQDVQKRSNEANAEVQAAAAAVKYAEQHPDLPKFPAATEAVTKNRMPLVGETP